MKKIVSTVLAAFVVLAVTTSVVAQQPGDRNDIRKLMDVTGVAELMGEMGGMLITQLKSMAPDVPESEWGQYEKRLQGKTLIDMSVPFYAKHFTPEEIDQLIKFYSTPVGQKTIETMPLVLRESMQAGQKWGQETGMKIIEDLEADGYTVTRPTRPGPPR
jgi:hypothetical protein